MTGPDRGLRAVCCVAAVALHVGALDAAEAVVTKPAQRLAAFLQPVPSSYWPFQPETFPPAKEVSDIMRPV